MPIKDPLISYNGPTGFPSVDCTPTALPTVTFSDCPEGYQAHESEIIKVFISNAEWNSSTKIFEADVKPTDHQDSSDYAVAGIITLIGFGDKPLPEVLTVPIPNNQLKVVNRRHIVNFDFTDMHLNNYEAVRALQGLHHVAIWYQDIDGYIYGGADGIIARIVNAGTILARGENALATGQIQFEWKNLFDPPADELDPVAPMMAGKVKTPAPLKPKPEPVTV